MTAISSGDATILRYQYRRVTDLHVNVVPLRVIASATISSGSFTYPRAEYNVESTSTWSDAKRDYMFRIFDPSGNIRFEGSCRKKPLDNGDGTGTLYTAGHVKGDTGTAQLQAVVISAGDSVEIYDKVGIKSNLSRISGSTFYKMWDIAYSDQNENPRPVVNIGIDRQHSIADGGTQTGIVFDASDSFSWNGNSLTYLWTLPGSVTITTGTTTSSSITVSATHGIHNIECRVTDSVTGSSKRGHRWLFVNDSSNTPSFSDLYGVYGLSIENGVQGTSISFTVEGDVDESYLYTGADVLVTWSYEFSDDGETWVQPTETVLHRRTAKAFMRDFDMVHDAHGIKTYRITAVDILRLADELPIATQVMIRNNSPTDWTQVHSRLMNMAGLIYQIAEFHCSAMLLTNDFDKDDFDTVTRSSFEITDASIGAAMRRSMRYLPGSSLVNAMDGRLLMRRSICYEPDADVNALPTRWTWQDTDVIEQIGYQINEIMQAGITEGGCFVDATPSEAYLFSRAMGASQMQGIGVERVDNFVASSESAGQAYVGHHHAFINRNVDYIPMRSLVDVFDVATMEKHLLDLSSYDTLSRQVLSAYCYADRVNYTFDADGDVSIECRMIPQTRGKPAETVPRYTVSETAYTPYNTFTETWDFTADDGAPCVSEFDGSYTASTGYDYSEIVSPSPSPSVLGNQGRRWVVLSIPALKGKKVTSIEATVNLTKGTFAGFSNMMILSTSQYAITPPTGVSGDVPSSYPDIAIGLVGSLTEGIVNTDVSDGTAITLSWTDINFTCKYDYNYLTICCDRQTLLGAGNLPVPSGSLRVIDITINGKGRDPFGGC